ncbi:MAG TPA: ribosome biogenesis GTP-binding protein YihA/YsxC [Thermoanaerobaculaceae bacterium]|nr:ribosome biogenesis GTP-binding protein YihA/YsxC [Thermoanaerobaculaceae bacterium]HPS78474.1 ribosome biogenesis GTP-binding protein YihA/YsxC [Thermoanaerobaculaceae bacterium]
MRIENVELRATVADFRRGPRESFPQVAFAGRSNVGKSSLLNKLLDTRLAAVSKQPGKTRTINYYLVNKRFYFVDLPGYGYARTSQAERAAWGERITAYLLQDARLKMVVGLVDPRVPTSDLDVDLSGFVRQAGRLFLAVLTKADKLGRGALAQAAQRVWRDLDLETAPLAVSALTGSGCRELLTAIQRTLEDTDVPVQGA